MAAVPSVGNMSLLHVWTRQTSDEGVSLNTLSNCTRSNQIFSHLQSITCFLASSRRMYTMYKQVPKGEHQITFCIPHKFYTSNELDRVIPPPEETISWNGLYEITRSLLDNLLQPYEQLLCFKKTDKLMADSELQEYFDYIVNSDDMTEGFSDALTQTASLPTFEERSAMAEQLQILHTMAQARIRLSAKRVGETSTSCNDHLHILLHVQDLYEEATRCLE